MAGLDSHVLSAVLPPFPCDWPGASTLNAMSTGQLLGLNGKQFLMIQIVTSPVGRPFTYLHLLTFSFLEGDIEGEWSEHLPPWLLIVPAESFSRK